LVEQIKNIIKRYPAGQICMGMAPLDRPRERISSGIGFLDFLILNLNFEKSLKF
jgi:hypothetical protein